MAEPVWLVADLGGTNTRVALADATGLIPGTRRRYANRDLDGPAAALSAYLDALRPGPVAALCMGVAGPVRGGTARLTNCPWEVSASMLAALTGAARVHLLNDLQAQGYALDDLPAGAITTLLPGRPDPRGARLVLNLGTGCNIAAVHRLGARLFVPASESGHTTLPDRPALRPLYDRLRADEPHLPVEAALSGPGVTRLHAALAGAHLPAEQVLSGGNHETLVRLADLLGEVAGNFCLAHMATGGLFLTGSVARALAPHLRKGACAEAFTAAFTARGPYADILRAIPVALIEDDTAALVGCARYLRQRPG